jgi:transposase
MVAFWPPMLTQEQAVEIRVLARQGASIHEIARQMGCSRNTVRRYLRSEQAARYGPRAPRPCKLDAFHEYLHGRIEAARPHWIPATVLLREIRERGYTGGISQLKAYIAPFKRVPDDPVVRFETPPGKQMQADFTVVRRGRDPLLAFVATLGFSRASYVRFTDNENAETLVRCLWEAFEHFGGVPEQVLLDNAKTVVIERDAYGEGLHRWHGDLLALAERCGFMPRLCRPYRAKTKGKVERFNGYLKGSFLVPLAATLKSAGLRLDVDVANAHIGRWMAEVADVRTHGTTGEQPAARMSEERRHLQPLPPPTVTPSAVPVRMRVALPVESLQHPLSTYQALLEASA